MIVVDASVLVPALADAELSGKTARRRLETEMLAAPESVDPEVASVLRGLVRAGRLTKVRARRALDDLTALPIERASHRYLVGRCWELQHNLTTYDAAYVTLAELLGTVLVTADRRLSRAPGVRCRIELVVAVPGSAD